MAYPKAINLSDFKIGQKVILLMTHNGTERPKYDGCFDKWCVPACVTSVDEERITVQVNDIQRKIYGYGNGIISFLVKNRFREAGKTKPDFRLFLNKGDAFSYEHYRVVSSNHRKKHRKGRNQAALVKTGKVKHDMSGE